MVMINEIKTKMKVIKETKNFVKLVENRSTGKVFPDFIRNGRRSEQTPYFDLALYKKGIRRIVIEIEE